MLSMTLLRNSLALGVAAVTADLRAPLRPDSGTASAAPDDVVALPVSLCASPVSTVS